MAAPVASFDNTRFFGLRRHQETGFTGKKSDLVQARKAVFTTVGSFAGVDVTLRSRKHSHTINRNQQGLQPINPSRKAAFLSSVYSNVRTITNGTKTSNLTDAVQHRPGKSPKFKALRRTPV